MRSNAPINIGDAIGQSLTGLSEKVIPYAQQQQQQKLQAQQLEMKRYNDEFTRSYQLSKLKEESRRNTSSEFGNTLDKNKFDLALSKNENDPQQILGRSINSGLLDGSVSNEDVAGLVHPSISNTGENIKYKTDANIQKQTYNDAKFESQSLSNFTKNLNQKATYTLSAKDKALGAERKTFDSEDAQLSRLLSGNDSSEFNFSQEGAFANRAVSDTTSAMNEFATIITPIAKSNPKMYNRLVDALKNVVGEDRLNKFNSQANNQQEQNVDQSLPLWEQYGYRDANHMLGDLEQDYQNGDITKEKYLEWKTKLGY